MKPATNYISFNNRQYSKLQQCDIPWKIFISEDANYQLKVSVDRNNFILKMSTGQIIKDSFTDFGDRADLYKLIEIGEVYNWMLEVMLIAHINHEL